MMKADSSVSIHADDRAYKPLNWMSPPCSCKIRTSTPEEQGTGLTQVWEVTGKSGETLVINLGKVFADLTEELGLDPGLQKDGVEAHLQELLADNPQTFGECWTTVRREYPTAIGPVDLLLRHADGHHAAVEVKRRGEIDGVEQLTRYLDLMRRDPLLGEVEGIFAAQQIKPQARTLAADRGITCVTVDYDALRGIDDSENRLF